MTKRDEHTPGPWRLSADCIVTTVDGAFRIGGCCGSMSPADPTRHPANARLIADAPETKRQRDALLAAAEQAAEVLARFTEQGETSVACKALRSAIAQARGETR